MNSLVSICIPTYNGEAFLNEALDSVLIQNYKNLEVIFSDDGSTDNTFEIIHEFKNHTSFEVSIYQNKSKGIGSNWNNCIKHARGEYIKFLFQDDILFPDCIEKMGNTLEDVPEDVKFVYSRKRLIGDKHNQQESADQVFHRFSKLSASKIISSRDLFNHPRNKIGEPTCTMLRKDVFREVGYFNEKLEQSLDYEFWYRILGKYSAKSIDENLVGFRIHENQATMVNAGKVNIDSYLLPYLLLTEHNRNLHMRTFFNLIYKLLTGLVRYSIYVLLRRKKI